MPNELIGYFRLIGVEQFLGLDGKGCYYGNEKTNLHVKLSFNNTYRVLHNSLLFSFSKIFVW